MSRGLVHLGLLGLVVVVALAGRAAADTGTLAAAEAGAEAAGEPATPAAAPAEFVWVIEVEGLFDRVLVDFVETQIYQARAEGAVALVLQLNSGGAVVSEDRLTELRERIERAEVPVHVWIGPSGSEAAGGAAQVVAAAAARCAADPAASPCVGISPGSRVEAVRELLDLAGVAPGEVRAGERVEAARAVELGIIESAAPVVGDFIVDLPGVESRVVERDGEPRRELVTGVRFAQLPLLNQLMHTAASPPIAYLFVTIGLALVVFELFTAGVGIAGAVGASSLVLGAYGLAELPTRPLAVALLLLAAFGFAVDVQTGVPRAWTAIAAAAFVAGSVLLYEGLSLSWITLLAGVGGMLAAMVAGMPAMVRTRFSTPTIGREWMVGEVGEALERIAPEGVVSVRGARWRARANRATPIEAGAELRVVSIDGLLLEVEPLVGAARDYRDLRRGQP